MTVFAHGDAYDESERRVRPAGRRASDIVLHEMERDLADGKWRPIAEDRARAERIRYEREDQVNDATRDWIAEHEGED